MNYKLFFHYLSYLQYPLLAGCAYFLFQSVSGEFDLNTYLMNMNNMLVLMGIAISFSTLQDSKKASLKFEQKIWKKPKAGKLFLIFLILFTLLVLVIGFGAYFYSGNENIKEISFGTIVFGIGLISFTKTAIEIFENHREDRKAWVMIYREYKIIRYIN